MKYMYTLAILLLAVFPYFALAQDDTQEPGEEMPSYEVSINTSTQKAFPGKSIDFSASKEAIPEEEAVQEILWDTGDGFRTTGETISHIYDEPGTYTIRVTVNTQSGITAEDTTTVRIFEHVSILIADTSVQEDQIEIKQQQAAREDVLLIALRAKTGGPEAVTEEDLTNQLIGARDVVKKSNIIIVWTQGSVGTSVLSNFAQHLKTTDEASFDELDIGNKGVVVLSETPFGIIAPVAQSSFDQLHPAYIILTKPQAIDLLLQPLDTEEIKNEVFSSSVPHRILGTFSARTVRAINPINIMSFGINHLVNRGVPLNSITLLLMLPVIATILSFSRQVIGIKAFGIITPAVTTLSFLVTGLTYGLIIFSVILLTGTLMRIGMRKLRLLYLPRMALVLTSISIAILVVFGGLATTTENTALLSLSIFPILILTLVAEEFIAIQFKSGAKKALTTTAWTLALAIACYFIVSWQLLRTIIVSYPEVVLLTIPVNILLGRWSGLRMTEYFRFRQLLRYIQ